MTGPCNLHLCICNSYTYPAHLHSYSTHTLHNMSEPSTAISNGATAGPSRVARPMPPAFRPAASLIAATNGTNGSSAASLRNASSSGTPNGGNAAPEKASSSSTPGSSGAAGPSGTNGTTSSSGSSGGPAEGETPAVPAGPIKPVHRSVNSKNAIIYSAVQVSQRDNRRS
jgi:hypothetical protein